MMDDSMSQLSGLTGNRQPLIRGLTAVLLALSVTLLSLRFVARRLSRAGLWYDDWLLVFGAFVTVVIDILTFVGVNFGLGLHTAEAIERNGPQAPVRYGKILFSTMLTYQWAMTAIKMSILALYIRLFNVNRYLRWTVYSIGAFLLLWHFSYFFALLFQCMPIAFFWDRSIPGGHCVDHDAINNNSLSVSNAATNVFTDIMILLAPLPLLLGLHLSWYRKAGLTIIFVLGASDTAIGIIRMKQLINGQTADLLWSNSLPQLWTVIELNIGVICACLPVLLPLFKGAFKNHVLNSSYRFGSHSGYQANFSDPRYPNDSEPVAKGTSSPTNSSANAATVSRQGHSKTDSVSLRSITTPSASDRTITVTTDVHQYAQANDPESNPQVSCATWPLGNPRDPRL